MMTFHDIFVVFVYEEFICNSFWDRSSACERDFLKKKMATRAGFEPARAEPKGTCILRLNHSAIVSSNGLFRPEHTI
ncbi:unnamed protein product [Debaryomyces tyrocola]|nr:unnamed protein product [Debaryomyces tyrocola]